MRSACVSPFDWLPRTAVLFVFLGVGGALTGALPAGAQMTFPRPTQPSAMQTTPQPAAGTDPLNPPGDADPMRARMEAQRAHSLEDERHKRMETDAARLLTLATELKEDVNKAGKDELSLEVLRKAAEIEKLAHDVRERMK